MQHNVRFPESQIDYKLNAQLQGKFQYISGHSLS